MLRADADLRHLDDDLAAPHGEGPRPGDARVLFMDPAAVRDAVRPSPFPLPLPSPPRPLQGTNQNIIGVNLGYLCRVRLKFNVKLK